MLTDKETIKELGARNQMKKIKKKEGKYYDRNYNKKKEEIKYISDLSVKEVCRVLENKNIKVIWVTTDPNSPFSYTVFYKDK